MTMLCPTPFILITVQSGDFPTRRQDWLENLSNKSLSASLALLLTFSVLYIFACMTTKYLETSLTHSVASNLCRKLDSRKLQR